MLNTVDLNFADYKRGRRLVVLVFFLWFLSQTAATKHCPEKNTTVWKEQGVCQSRDVRNSVDMFNQLKGCRVVEGFVQIVLIDKAVDADYANVTFPELREITDYLLLYRVQSLTSLGKIFPNLSVIRGNTLFLDYALVIFEMLNLQEIGLTSLTNILRGGVYFAKNPLLCFVDTIAWDLIAPAGKENHYITENKQQDECPLCPTNNQSCPTSPITGDPLCWNSQHCQKVFTLSSDNKTTCTADGECCDKSCLGGCSGPTPCDCFACKNVSFVGRCVNSCPSNTYEYLNRRCVQDTECFNMPKPREITDFNVRHNPWKPFEGKCLFHCPNKFLEVERILNKTRRYICEPCEGVCKRECPGASVDSIASAQKLKGCTSIKGALEIQIRGGSNVVKELEENLSMIEEIDDYLKIVRSFPLVSLNFLRKLREIHGYKLESSKNALVVLDNQNLVELWDWENRSTDFKIRHGKLFFHFNPKLCLSKIEKLKNVTGLPDYTDLEVASNSNGDKVACIVAELNATIAKKTATVALIKWKQFEHYDSRTLLGYVIHYIEAPHQNVSMYDGRDACGGDGWKVDDISHEESKDSEDGVSYLLTQLKPYTQYAFYVRTYTIATEKSGAQSPIKYFRTLPDTPTEPRALTAFSNSSSELVINWQPPSHANGNVTLYMVFGHWQKDSELLDQRDYCTSERKRSEPTNSGGKSISKPIYEEQETEKLSEFCSCKQKLADNKQREKEIHFEDHLQNQIYVKRYNSKSYSPGREKRDATTKLSSKLLNDSENNLLVDGVYVKFERKVHGTTLVMRNLRHFAMYNIAVRACREREEGEKPKGNNCSAEALATVRTQRLLTADNVENHFPIWEVSNKTLGMVLLKWNEPVQPNSLIVTYQIEYKRTDIENYQPTIECITRKQFQSDGNTYTLRNLAPGNYSLRLRATSLFGHGDYTPAKYFYIEEGSSMSVMQMLLMTLIGIILILALLFGMALYLRRQYSQVPSRKLIASVNPEYVPTVYEPDDWEVPRSRVELLKEIGQGSFGMVYEGILRSASDTALEQCCAVKTVNVQAADRDRIEFLNEASVMKAFNTHHVVKLLGVVSQGQPTLVVMELMANGDLKSYLRSHRPDSRENPNASPPSLNRILCMAAEIADGMAYLSAKKFVHRDLAARNCMVSDDLTVKIGDFGMTRDIYETEYYRKGSKGLLPVRWMAPESLKDGVFTSHSDAWSYGVVLYEMVTLASQPYQGLSNDQVLRYVIDGGIMERPDNCPDKLYNVMRLCWNQKPSSRPSFLDLVTYLHQDVGSDFHAVSFYDSEEGVELRGALGGEETPLSITREIEDFSLSDDDDDYKQPRSSTSSKVSNGSTTPNGYVPQQVKTTKC